MDASTHLFRYAGGHIHVGSGFDKMDKKAMEQLVQYGYTNDFLNRLKYLIEDENGHLEIIKTFDLIGGIPLVMLDSTTSSLRRRSKYGKAGCFRPTPYGVEWRTPSCWWLKSPTYVSLIYGLIRAAWGLLLEKTQLYTLKEMLKYDEQEIRGIIDESDTTKAYEVWKKWRPFISIVGIKYDCTTNPITPSLKVAMNKTDEGERPWLRYSKYKKMLDGGSENKIDKVCVYPMAIMEYMLKEGYQTADEDMVTEWRLNEPNDTGVYGVGFITGNTKKMIANKDFLNFQTAFLAELA
jgi:hypothetical protein